MNIEKQKPKKKHEIVRTFIYFASENHDAINFLPTHISELTLFHLAIQIEQ